MKEKFYFQRNWKFKLNFWGILFFLVILFLVSGVLVGFLLFLGFIVLGILGAFFLVKWSRKIYQLIFGNSSNESSQKSPARFEYKIRIKKIE